MSQKNNNKVYPIFFMKAISFNGMAFFLFILLLLNDSSAKNGIWVVRYALNSQYQSDKIVGAALDLGAKDIYLQVFAKGETWYDSDDFIQHKSITSNTVLKKIIKKSHDSGIRVHAWLNIFNIWSGNKPPENHSHPYWKYRRSILHSAQNSENLTYKELLTNGNGGFYLDPSNAALVHFYTNIVTELDKKFNFDGIHLDYFRYPKNGFIFSKTGRDLFKEKEFCDPLQYFDNRLPMTNENLSKINYYHQKYRKFLKDNLNHFLFSFQKNIKKINPNLILSVAVKPNIDTAKDVFYQDWGAWTKNNYCDYVVLMNYAPSFDDFTQNMNKGYPYLKQGTAICGLAVYNQPEIDVVRRIKYLREKRMKRYVLFSYNYLVERPEYLKNLIRLINKMEPKKIK
jgi:uncharacterized lipoprotein YddW (UPF0748 family)